MIPLDQFNITTEILSVDEARRRLPDIRPRLRRLARVTEELRACRARLAAAGEKSSGRSGPLPGRVVALEAAFRNEVRALNAAGASVKDAAVGLVDFYTWRGDDLACLCFRLGEETIRWWHGLHDGFAGRSPIED